MSVWLSGIERRALWSRRRRTLAVLLAVFLALLLLDKTIYERLYVNNPDTDFMRTLRVTGSLWPWLFVGAALIAQATALRPRVRGLAGAGAMIFLSAALSGLIAEGLQVLTGRLRPNKADPEGTHQFRGLLDRFHDTSNLAFPSSHAAVAFGAAFLLWFVYPRAGAVALVAAAGCGLTRMLAGAHFASDVFAAAVLGYATARLLRPGGWRGLAPRPLLP